MINKQYYLVILFFFSLLAFVTGCKSVMYDYDEPLKSDTVKITEVPSNVVTTAIEAKPVKNYYIRSSPSFTLQINGNYNLGLSELSVNSDTKNQVQHFERGLNFGTKSGFGVFVIGKKPFLKYENIRLVFIGAANFFSNKKFSSTVSDNGKINYQVYTLGAGFENSFTPSFKIKPYLGAAVLVNALMGHAEYINDDTVFTDVKIKPSFRIGLSVSAGLEYLFSDRIGLNMGINVISANLLFKQSHTSDSEYEVFLRDKRHAESKLFLSGYKQFLFASFYTGINIYFGIKEKSYRF